MCVGYIPRVRLILMGGVCSAFVNTSTSFNYKVFVLVCPPTSLVISKDLDSILFSHLGAMTPWANHRAPLTLDVPI